MSEQSVKNGYRLISGVFSPSEANRILMSLILDKINFHHKSNWSHKERFGEPDSASVKRMQELNQTKADLSALIEHAESSNQKLAINCEIEITLAPAQAAGSTASAPG